MPSGVSSKVRSQIRGLKNSKPSNNKSAKKDNKTANKFAKGGPLKPKEIVRDNKYYKSGFKTDMGYIPISQRKKEDFFYDNVYLPAVTKSFNEAKKGPKNSVKRLEYKGNVGNITEEYMDFRDRVQGKTPYKNRWSTKDETKDINDVMYKRELAKGGKLKSASKKFKCGGKVSRKKC